MYTLYLYNFIYFFKLFQEYEKAYLPSCWSKRWDSEELLQHYFKKCEDSKFRD